MPEPNRSMTVTVKFQTNFGSMYAHLSFTITDETVSASISHHKKDFDSQISQLIDQINEAFRAASEEVRSQSRKPPIV